MKRFFFFLFSIPFLLHAQTESPVVKLFLSLPDSIFTGTPAFSKNDSFYVHERRKMLAAYGAGVNEFGHDTVRFVLQQIDDSTGLLEFSDLGERRITLKLLRKKGKSAFICIMTQECDFVMCTQHWFFYTVSAGKIVKEQNALPACLSPELFFRKTYLDSLDNAAPPCMDGLTFHFRSGSNLLYADFNYDFFDKELFGEDGAMTKLVAEGLLRDELALELKGKKFLLKD